jgi:pyruvate,water dikinase
VGRYLPNGFALTADVYRLFRKENNIEVVLNQLFAFVRFRKLFQSHGNRRKNSKHILSAKLSTDIKRRIHTAYQSLCEQSGIENLGWQCAAATAEDLPTASFAGRMESHLNISGQNSWKRPFKVVMPLFTDRAIKYRMTWGSQTWILRFLLGFNKWCEATKQLRCRLHHRSDTGFQNTIIINSSWGLGENIVKGTVT